MTNILQFPKAEFSVSAIKYLYKLYYIKENDTLWASMEDCKTKKWGPWVMISEGFLSGNTK